MLPNYDHDTPRTVPNFLVQSFKNVSTMQLKNKKR